MCHKRTKKMNISREQYEAAYQIGLELHDRPEEIGIAEAKRRLQSTGLNENSAADLVYDVGHLLRGECYKRAMSEAATDDYLTWIRRDRKSHELRNALTALEQHIAYRRQKKPTDLCQGLVRLLKKHRNILSSINESSLVLEWRDGEPAGLMDWFPLSWFAEEGVSTNLFHLVGADGRPQGKAWCDLTVKENIAELDYQPYRKLNNDNEVFLGVVLLTFADEDRTAIVGVEWKDPNEGVFVQADVRLLPPVIPSAGEAYQPPAGAAAKVTRQVRERPGQAKFRRTLKLAYGHRCCISGCSVPEVLEGAHIDRYLDEESHHIQNGLLLRADLHMLFDRHLIAIDPETMSVHVAKGAHGNEGYRLWQGTVVRLPNDPTHHPSQAALRRRWQEWQKV